MGKPTICIGENKDADQLRGNREDDQRLCFRYSDSTIPLLLKSKISGFYLYSVTVQPGLCRTWLETKIVGFLMHKLISYFTQSGLYQIWSANSVEKCPSNALLQNWFCPTALFENA